jgi:hypothetical protein
VSENELINFLKTIKIQFLKGGIKTNQKRKHNQKLTSSRWNVD